MISTSSRKIFTLFVSLFVFCCVLNNNVLKAQTTLVAGDIVFTGFNSVGTAGLDTMTFVLLKTLDANTVVNFTDRGYGGSSFNADNGSSESSIRWSSGAAELAVGTEIFIVGLEAKLVSSSNAVGTVTAITGTVGLSLAGLDQIIAYQGTIGSSPTLIAGIHWNNCSGNTTSALWDPTNCNVITGTSGSTMPPGLANGSSAMWAGVTEGVARIAGKFNCAGAPFSTVTAMRSAILSNANWSTITSNVSPFTVRSRCNYSIALPVKIVTFSSQVTEGNVILNWKTADAVNVSHFEIERSTDAKSFTKVGEQQYRDGTNSYNFPDLSGYPALNSGKLYYRLKLVDLDGSTAYSKTISALINKDGKAVTTIAYPNPFQSTVTVFVPGIKGTAEVEVINNVGKVVLERNVQIKDNTFDLDLNQSIPSGQYILKVNGKAFEQTVKVIKE